MGSSKKSLSRSSGRHRGRESQEVASGVLELSWHGSVATVLLNGVESSCIDVEHPEHLEFEYMQHMDVAVNVLFGNEPIRALHLGGAAASLPWAWSVTHPGSRQTVVEIDPVMIEAVREWFDLPRAPQMKMRCQDARVALDSSTAGVWDVIVRDAFADGQVPVHLATRESSLATARALKSEGVYLLNAAHGGGADARRELPALHTAFRTVFAVLDPKVGRGGRRGNVVFICTNRPSDDHHEATIAQCDRLLRRLPLPARVMCGQDLGKWHAGVPALDDATVGWES